MQSERTYRAAHPALDMQENQKTSIMGNSLSYAQVVWASSTNQLTTKRTHGLIGPDANDETDQSRRNDSNIRPNRKELFQPPASCRREPPHHHPIEQARDERILDLEQDLPTLKNRLRDVQEQLAEEQTAKKQAEEKNAALESALRTAKHSQETLQYAHDQAVKYCQAAHSDINHLQNQLGQHERTEQQLRDTVATLNQENQQRAQLIEQRSGEIQLAKEFLDSRDKLSGADVVGMVRNLNEQIFQISAAIADPAQCQYKRATLDSPTTIIADKRHILEHLLQTTDHRENPELVEIALQNILVQYSLSATMTWGNHSKEIQGFLDALAGSIREEQIPAISRRWRAITHVHATSLGRGTDELVKKFTRQCLSSLTKILQLSGGAVDNSMQDVFGPRISNLLHQAFNLRKVINQDIMSCEYVLFQGKCGSKFNVNTMLDHEQDEVGLKKSVIVTGTVVRTTGLGVMKVSTDKKNAEERAILLKPKVVRDSYLQSIKDAIEMIGSDHE